MKFKDIPYRRPDIEAVKRLYTALTEKLKSAADYAQARAVFVEKDALERQVATQSTLAEVRHSIDTRDAFYDAEVTFWDAVNPELEAFDNAWTVALLESPFRADFEAEFGEVVFLNAELQRKAFAPEIVPLLQQENELVTAYDKLIAGAQIDFRGEIYTLAQLGVFKSDADDAVRLAAWKAEGQWLKENQAELDRIYDELVHLRDQMARTLGYDNFVPLGYYRMQRNCYDAADVARFREAVQKYVVPVADSIYRAQAKRIGADYPLSFADAALKFRSGNPKPQGSAQEILEAGRRFYEALSDETGKFFNGMLENEMLDVLATPGKQAGGYCTTLFDYHTPFIFANFNGTSSDVETVTHEAGHAFADWYNNDRVPAQTVWPSLEGCEVHSMSMEFFAWRAAEDFFGDDARKFKYSHLAGALCFIPYGTMVDHFQHIVYENPSLTPAERHAAWKKLLGVYMPWLKLDGDIPFYSDGEGWQRQIHIYQVPFYYIDYCLAQTVALAFWAMLQKDAAAAWKTYLAYTAQGGSQVFTTLLKNAGLKTPFEEETLKDICGKAAVWLDHFDLSGIL